MSSLLINSYVNKYIQKNAEINANKITVIPASSTQNSWRTHTKAFKPVGQIVKSNPFSIKKALNDDFMSLRYFADGIRGKGDDYSIGRINDIGIKLGALGIASIIATSKGSPLKKGMEFVGMTCWLGAMSLWPKLAINLPVKLTKGINLDTEYITAREFKKHKFNGKRKSFYQDPQFICWDMVSDKEIHKLGDKLGIPKEIKNRRQTIEKKAKQIAIQGNTLALLTAGFSTPLIASLCADQIGKRVLSPAIEKYQTSKALKMEPAMLESVDSLLSDKQAEENITKLLAETITPKNRKEILSKLYNLTDDINIRKDIKNTLSNILEGKNATEIKININDDIANGIAGIFSKDKNSTTKIAEVVKNIAQKYNNSIKSHKEISFIQSIRKELSKQHIMGLDASFDKVNELQEFLASSRTVKLNSIDAAKAKLVDLSQLLVTYNKKSFNDFEKQYFNFIWNSEVSNNAKIWEEMKAETLKILGIEGDKLKQVANAPSNRATHNALSSIINNLINDPDKYSTAMENLGKMANKLTDKNQRHLEFSLNYLDKIQHLLTSYDRKGELSGISNTIGIAITNMRKTVIGKYLSTSINTFLPIRVLSVLKAEQSLPENELKALEKMLFSEQTVDAFINNLDSFKDIIKDEKDYYKYVNKIFSKLSSDTKAKLPEGLAEKIDNTTELIKHILLNQYDGTKLKYPSGKSVQEESKIIISALKKLNLEKYADDIFLLDDIVNDNIVDWMGRTASQNSKKLDELKTFLKLNPQDIADIKNGNYKSISDALAGTRDIGKGFIKTGKNRIKTLLNFFNRSNIDELGRLDFIQSKTAMSTNVQGSSFKNFIKESAIEALAYSGWLKKVGYSFLALCAITGISIANFGTDNEYYRINKEEK